MKKWWKELIDKPLLKAFLHYYQASDSELTSVAVAYYWLISIFPLLLVVVNILPYFQIPVGEFLGFMKDVLPPSLYEGVEKIAREVLTQPSTGLLSFSVLSALWSFSKSMNFLQKAFNKAYGVEKSRGLISHQMLSLLVSFGLQLLFAFALFLILYYVHHLVDVRILGSVLLVVMMFWFILIAKIVILGAVINASMQSLKDPVFKKD
ncbi:YihY/virulence factor BrkB family protein [Streptococcus pneumoniae]|nr:YihY/virulence factor BrkB family protein [Streptococcus pneumoniae]